MGFTLLKCYPFLHPKLSAQAIFTDVGEINVSFIVVPLNMCIVFHCHSFFAEAQYQAPLLNLII